MSRFLNIFKKNRDKKLSKQVEIVNLTKKLQEALGVDDETLEQMVSDDHYAEYGNYLLVCNKRCFDSGWEDVIEIVPSYLGRDHGYANTTSMGASSGWHYLMKGTATECLPPTNVQDEVFYLISKENKSIQEVLPNSDKIKKLESELQIALNHEDYERASEIKKEIERLA